MRDEKNLYVPVQSRDEVVAVPVTDLPEDPTEILDVLHAELPPLGVWLEFAKAYLEQGKDHCFRQLIEDGQSPGTCGKNNKLSV